MDIETYFTLLCIGSAVYVLLVVLWILYDARRAHFRTHANDIKHTLRVKRWNLEDRAAAQAADLKIKRSQSR